MQAIHFRRIALGIACVLALLTGPATAGEGIFVKPWMEAVGLPGGRSRLPSRDDVVTPEVRARIRSILEERVAAVV